MNPAEKPFFAQALDALKLGDRRRGAELLAQELTAGDGSPDAIRIVFQLASHISEIDLAIEASRRLITPGSIESLAAYWGTLASYGRSDEALEDIHRQPVNVQEHPASLYRRAAMATAWGRFDEAQELFRQALAKDPAFVAAWISLAMIKTFEPGDPDIQAMERLLRQVQQPEAQATLFYALGKAREDCGEVDEAFELYAQGAAIRRKLAPFDMDQFRRAAEDAIAGFASGNMKRLIPSGLESSRSLFVTGLPRSGTTLTEQILRGHSAVVGGGEVNLFGASVLPTLGLRFDDALRYQERAGVEDPWGEIARGYGRLANMRFREAGLVVDKSLGQSLLVGLMLHALPDARIAWLRRSPDDVALSCFRTQFDGGLAWTSSPTDIADYMRIDDRLFEHWRSVFEDRILEVPYEDLVRSPDSWAERLQRHFGLPVEGGIAQASRAERTVDTASVMQVREPITTARIGRASAFERHLAPFRERYYGRS